MAAGVREFYVFIHVIAPGFRGNFNASEDNIQLTYRRGGRRGRSTPR